MRITDVELLEAIWQNQLRRLSRAVLSKYLGGRYGLVDDADFWYKSASSEHRISRSNITEEIGSQQLLKRLRELHKKGLLSTSHAGFLTFYIAGNNAEEAFKEARQWWKNKGVPEGIEDGACRTTPMDENTVKELSLECCQHLQTHFPSHA